MDANPFPEATSEPSRLHLFFLMGQPDRPDFECLRSLQSPTERFELKEGVLYLHAPDGIGRSKLAASIGRCLRVEMTARTSKSLAHWFDEVIHAVADFAGRCLASGDRVDRFSNSQRSVFAASSEQ